jgi:putative peptidoglycan lipid II flippase
MVPDRPLVHKHTGCIGLATMSTQVRAETNRLPSSPAPHADQSQGTAHRISVTSMGRSASIVAVAFIASRFLGLAREVVLAHLFGTGPESDAYVSAFRIPDFLFLVAMSGAFGAAFIPIFGGFLARNDREKAWRLASSVITLTGVVSIVMAIVIFAFAGPIMSHLVAPNLAGEYRDIAIRTMRLLLISNILLGFGIAAKGILEAQDLFTLPALAPLLYSLATILGGLILGPSMGVPGVAIGVVAGAACHVGVQIPGLVRSGMRFWPSLSLQVAGLPEVGKLLVPRVIGQAAFQINFIVVNYLANNQGAGKATALNQAWMLMMLPHGVLALSISTVAFPAMARQFETGRLDEVRATFLKALAPLLFLTLPASIGLYEFRTAIIQTVFQSGAFDAHSTSLVSAPLAFLALGLTWYALVEVLARLYYAMQDTKTPVAAGVAIIVINVVLGIFLVDRVGYAGLGLSLSVSTGIEAAILMIVLRRRTGGFDARFGSWFAKVVLATAVMALAAEAMRGPLQDATTAGTAPRIVQVMLLGYAIGIVGLTYFLAAYYLRLPEVGLLLGRMESRLPGLKRVLPSRL